MAFTIACSLLAASSIALFFPYFGYPWLLRLLPVRPVQPIGPKPKSMSLLFCFFNEAHSLPSKLENLRALRLRYPDLEILAYDDGSTDGSCALMDAAPDLVTVVQGEGRRGKAHGMKGLVAAAKGEIVMFTDANVLIDLNAPDAIMTHFMDPSVGGVCGSLHYQDKTGTMTEQVGGLYWRIEEGIKQLESRSGNVMGADGSIFAVRRDLYPEFPDHVLDDFTASMEVVFRGMRLIHASDARAYEASVSDSTEEYRRKLRIASRALQTHLALRPKLKRMSATDKVKYFLHKQLRWAGGLSFVIAVLSFIGMMLALSVVLGLLSLCAICLAAYCIATLRYRPLQKLREIVLAILATTIGAARGLLGYSQVIWSPAKSR